MKNLNVGRDRDFRCYIPLKTKIGDSDRLEIRVEYFIGGYNYFSGAQNPRGYRVAFKPCQYSNGMTSFVLMSGDSKREGGYIMIENATKYNVKRLNELAALVDSKVQMIANAYEADNKKTLTELCKVGKLTANPITAPVSTVLKSSQKIMTQEVIKKLPALYSQSGKEPQDVKVIVKFFDPSGSWTWYATEGEKTGSKIEEGAFVGEDDYRFFGFVRGFEGELGYFTLNELSTAKIGAVGMKALPIERDIKFGFDTTLAEVMKEAK